MVFKTFANIELRLFILLFTDLQFCSVKIMVFNYLLYLAYV